MVLTPSQMTALGEPLPEFSLPDVVSGNVVSGESFKGKNALLVMFICKHCPYVVHVQDELAKIGKDYVGNGLGVVGISSNDARKYSDDSPENLKKMATELDFNFPLCYDESQGVAKAFSAACTPDFFLYDEERRLVYRGQLDDSRPGSDVPVTGRDLRLAIDRTLKGEAIEISQKPSMGCNIKWKEGNEPAYFS